MDQLEIERLERVYETLSTPGWEDLADELETKIDQIKAALVDDFSSNGDLLKIAQGRILVYKELLSLRGSIQYLLEQSKIEVEPDDDSV